MSVAREERGTRQPESCTATTQYGRRCQKPPQPGKDVCWSHDPENAEARKQLARVGGMAVHSPAALEIQELKEELRGLATDVKEGKVAPGVGTVLNQLLNTILRAISEERKVRETEELAERIEALERGGSSESSRQAA
ncbi:MAG: hypothetical protein M3259_03660 [Actinomycetota bacterium]|nr:hypothetical protein [Actinomycetota bacterium]